MKVENVETMGLESSLIASGYSMRTETRTGKPNFKDVKRGKRLSKAGNAEEQFLTGIRIGFDLTCSNKMWIEAERYKFFDFVSSQSTMHCITKFDIKSRCNKWVDNEIAEIVQKKIDRYKMMLSESKKKDFFSNNQWDIEDSKELSATLKEKYLEILYNVPSGFEITAKMTTDYRCLKNMYFQRKDHTLPEWREFCKWIETLPYAKELILMEE